MGSVRQNPIQRTVRTAHLRVFMTTALHNTTQNSSDNLPSYLQKWQKAINSQSKQHDTLKSTDVDIISVFLTSFFNSTSIFSFSLFSSSMSSLQTLQISIKNLQTEVKVTLSYVTLILFSANTCTHTHTLTSTDNNNLFLTIQCNNLCFANEDICNDHCHHHCWNYFHLNCHHLLC